MLKFAADSRCDVKFASRVSLLCLLQLGASLAFGQRYEANWDSLDRRPIPEWFNQAKFGIFIHWGVYSVPAFAVNAQNENAYAEWYWNSLTLGMQPNATRGRATADFHRRAYGPEFQYADFAPQFRAELFNPDEWADIFARSGAKYIVPTSKHHDGFALWPSAQASVAYGRPWNAVETGPKRDLLGDLTDAVRRRGLKMGFYYSLYEWYNPLYLKDQSQYVERHMFPQFKDVVTRYKPSIIFSDGEWERTSAEWRTPELLAWLFNESPSKDEVVIDDRWGKDTRHKHGGYYTTEYTAGMQSGAHAWEESRGMGASYGYNRMEAVKDYRTERELVLMLVDIVSRGGNLLLDIGPAADGRIPPIMEERLLQMGDWLKVNGEAIYGAKQWTQSRQFGPGKTPAMEEKEFRGKYDLKELVDAPPAGVARIDAFFTRKDGAVYAILPRWPTGEFTIKNISAAGVRAELLETKEPLRVSAAPGGIAVRFPAYAPEKYASRNAYVLKLTGVKPQAVK
jgi:alpha-L-fucosidase